MIDALHNSDFGFPVSMNTRLKMYSVSRWRKARRNKVKEKSAHILVAPIECTMQKGKKTRFRFFTFPKNGKLRCIWENRVVRKSGNDGFCITKATVVCNIQFSSRWHIACSGGRQLTLRKGAVPLKWINEKKRKVPWQRKTSLNVNKSAKSWNQDHSVKKLSTIPEILQVGNVNVD